MPKREGLISLKIVLGIMVVVETVTKHNARTLGSELTESKSSHALSSQGLAHHHVPVFVADILC